MKRVLFIILCFWGSIGYAQVDNDECLSAISIPNIINYCSGPEAFSTMSATRSPDANPDCWPPDTETNDIWFTFVPTNTGIFIQVLGATTEDNGTLVEPSMAIYTGSCRSLTLEACSSVQPGDPNLTELTLTDLVIGRVYYLRVDGRNNNVGTFELCIDQFNPQKAPEADCDRAVVLCDKSSFFIENLTGVGLDQNEVTNSCIQEEFASVWYKWTADEAGTLEFVLTPNNITDDLDFALYNLPGGLDDCANKELIRCMSSGESQGNSSGQNAPCKGATGLSSTSNDLEEFPGCSPGDDNFVAAINMIPGESYALVVNNFSRSGFGFSIDFGGTGSFQGPEPEFSFDALEGLECDKRVFFIEQSKDNGDPIDSYQWSFGEGADPLVANGQNPPEVTYESFGSKIVALTIETSKGCRVTKLLNLDVASCCQDDSSLELTAQGQDLSCFESEDGEIILQGVDGFPEYLYSFEGAAFQPSPNFMGLEAGEYVVGIQDIKGCETFDTVMLNQPVELTVDVSTQEDTVDLGFSTFFSSTYAPTDRFVIYEWSPPNGLLCTDCPNPEIFGVGDITYTLTITDEDGCMASDQVTLFTNLNRNFYAPNIMSLSSVSGNDEFKIITNPATEIIEEVSVFDRWGGRLYHATDIIYDLNDGLGWKGEASTTQFVNPGVYIWMARIRFIDGEVIPFKGTITVIN